MSPTSGVINYYKKRHIYHGYGMTNLFFCNAIRDEGPRRYVFPPVGHTSFLCFFVLLLNPYLHQLCIYLADILHVIWRADWDGL